MLFINTRPANRAKKLTEFLQNHSVDVVDLPLLALNATPLTASDQQQLNCISQVNVVIMVSEAAVTFGLQALAKVVDLATVAQLPIHWFTVGEATANCFYQVWQSLSDTPPPNVIFPSQKLQQNNEGLLTLPQIDSLQQGDRVQLWRGVGGRELLANRLIADGVEVQPIHFYQRILPSSTCATFAALQTKLLEQQPRIVLISSLTAWRHWQQLVTESAFALHDFGYLVLQPRIATLMTNEAADIQLTVIDDLQPPTIYQAIGQLIQS